MEHSGSKQRKAQSSGTENWGALRPQRKSQRGPKAFSLFCYYMWSVFLETQDIFVFLFRDYFKETFKKLH